MNIEIEKSRKEDIQSIMPIFDEARRTIAKLGIDQWQNGYPNRDVIDTDIDMSQSYSIKSNGEIIGTFALIECEEPTYNKIYNGEWLTGNERNCYFAVHRVTISVKCRGMGISTAIINYCSDRAKEANKKSIRIDTHQGNIVMRRMLEKHDFAYCGIIHLSNGDERVAYEKLI